MENKIDTVEPAYLPGQKLNFLIDWLVTLKCNFNCAYCGLTGHDNLRPHPPVEKCIETLDGELEKLARAKDMLDALEDIDAE